MPYRARKFLNPLKGAVIKWLLRDDFLDTLSAGSVHGTACTPGPGLRVVVDTDGDGISIGGGVLTVANPNSGFGDPGFWITDSLGAGFAQTAGRMIFHRMTFPDTVYRLDWGVDSDTSAGLLSGARFWTTGGNVFVREVGSAATGPYTAAQHDTVVIMRAPGAYYMVKGGAYTLWTLLYIGSAADVAELFPAISTYSADGYTFAQVRVPADLWVPPLLAYDTFTRANSDSLGSTETTGPESQTVSARAWTTIGGDFDIASNAVAGGDAPTNQVTNGDMETWNSGTDCANFAGLRVDEIQEAVDVQAGTYSLKLELQAGEINGYVLQDFTTTANSLQWGTGYLKNVDASGGMRLYGYDTETNRTFHIANGVNPAAWALYGMAFAVPDTTSRMLLQITGVAGEQGMFDSISLVEMHAEYIDVGEADVQLLWNITTPGSGTAPFGLIVRCSGLTMWLVLITPGTAGTDLQMIELNTGVPVVRATADIDWTASTAYKIQVSCSGTTISVFVNGTLSVTYASATVGQSNTQIGMFDSASSNASFADVLVAAKDGAYEKLSKYTK